MKEYKILISISAENENDKDEILECYREEHHLEEEWWCAVK